MKKATFLSFSLFLFSFLAQAELGTYNLHYTKNFCDDGASEWSNYYLGPTVEQTPDGTCLVDPTKNCHDYQEFAANWEDFRGTNICEFMGGTRCEIFKVFVERDANDAFDNLVTQRISFHDGVEDLIENKKTPLEKNNIFKGSYTLPSKYCEKGIVIQYEIIPILKP